MSITDIKRKIKSISPETKYQIYVIFVICLTALGSFSLGRLSVRNEKTGVEIVYPEEIVARAQQSIVGGREVVASRTGTKYYFEWCEGADALSLKNKITFQSPEEAEIAGYELASNCGS